MLGKYGKRVQLVIWPSQPEKRHAQRSGVYELLPAMGLGPAWAYNPTQGPWINAEDAEDANKCRILHMWHPYPSHPDIANHQTY